MLIVIFICYDIQKALNPWEHWINCPSESGGNLTCLGVSAVYRMSFAQACFYVLLFLSMCCRNSFSKAVNEGLWCWKVTALVGYWFLLLFVQNSFFDGYLVFAKYVSILYLIF
jgi:hypothetical protein